MTNRELFEQALKALETNNQAWKHLADSGDAGFWEAEEQPFYETSVKAITALKAALAEPTTEDSSAVEPVAIVGTQEDTWKGYGGQWLSPGPPIKTVHMLAELPVGTPLYTAPPQRKPLTEEEIWRTYKNLWMFHPAEEPRLAGDVLKFARAIERAHEIT